MKNLREPSLILLAMVLLGHGFAHSQGKLENPKNGSIASGISLFSGWICEAEVVELVIDGGSSLRAAYGTERNDTEAVCNDTNNGFGLLFNMSLLESGEHQVALFADGALIARSTFDVAQLSSGEFLRNAEATSYVYNFPQDGKEIQIEWSESAQNFLIRSESITPDPLDVSGIWFNQDFGLILSVSSERVYPSRQEIYVVASPIDPNNGFVGSAYTGYVRNEMATISSVIPEGFFLDGTISFAGISEATLQVDACVTTNPAVFCTVEVGQTLSLTKVQGNMKGR